MKISSKDAATSRCLGMKRENSAWRGICNATVKFGGLLIDFKGIVSFDPDENRFANADPMLWYCGA